MNIQAKIKEKLAKARGYANIKRVERLQALKTKRLRLEGEANLIKLENKEKERIMKAKKVKNENRFKGLKKNKMTKKANVLFSDDNSSKEIFKAGDSEKMKRLYG